MIHPAIYPSRHGVPVLDLRHRRSRLRWPRPGLGRALLVGLPLSAALWVVIVMVVLA